MNRRLGLIALFILVVMTGTVLLKVSGWDKNYFEVLGVPRSATARDIKQAYRTKSMDLHPDKNPSKEAEDLFLLVSKAHTTLTNDEFRDAYDRWGERGLKWVETSKSIELQGLIDFGMTFFAQIVLVFMLTTSVSSTNARSYAYGALGVMMVLIASMRFGEDDLPTPFFPSMTKDQKCELLVEVFGLVVLTIGAIQRAVFFDLDEALVDLLRRIEIQQAAILHRMQAGGIIGPGSQQRNRQAAAAATEAQGEVAAAPPRQKTGLPDIPSWAYLLLVVAISQYFGKEK